MPLARRAWRRNARAQGRFPSLFAAGRPNVGRSRNAAPKGDEGEGSGGSGAGGAGDGGGEETEVTPLPEGEAASPS
ncbi:uncharacterized protein SOCE26_062150 [Sorangium cellulosum]|uniref:Uncharacterized protein n=1 Tax=Sorangium cellulosum TaxID=56 RepID=A0A2L0EZK4_SORCE|nr:uncharacterized protein SOCE26_062150 [Sorangium cellulosum]